MTDQQDWDAAAVEAGYMFTSEYVAKWKAGREAAHEALQTAQELITENLQLRAAVKDAYDCFSVYGEHMPEYMHGESLKTHIKRYRAALQPKEGE